MGGGVEVEVSGMPQLTAPERSRKNNTTKRLLNIKSPFSQAYWTSVRLTVVAITSIINEIKTVWMLIQGSPQAAEEFPELGKGAVLPDELDEPAAHDNAVGHLGGPFGLLYRGDAKTYG